MILNFDIVQNTEEWINIKVGMFSASSSADLLMDKKTKGYTGLINKIVEERMTGTPSESKKFQGNWSTERGHELEPIAREDYEMRTFNTVKIIGVIQADDWVLCSPDGLIDDNGMHQIKCPIFNTQREYLHILSKHEDLSDNEKIKKLSSTYYKQMQFELFVSGREFNVFTSFHPKLSPIDLTLVRDEDMISNIKNSLREAKKEVIAEIKLLKSYEG